MPVAMVGGVIGTAAVALATDVLIWRPLRQSGAGTLQLFLVRHRAGFRAAIHHPVLRGQSGAQPQPRCRLLGDIRSVAPRHPTGGCARRGACRDGRHRRRAPLHRPRRRTCAPLPTTPRWPRCPASTQSASSLSPGSAQACWPDSRGSSMPPRSAPSIRILARRCCLGLFAAAILGGIGNAYGALVGGLVIGLSQEWATLLVTARWKPAVGFAILIFTLLLMPNGIFGRVRRRS